MEKKILINEVIDIDEVIYGLTNDIFDNIITGFEII